MNTGTKEVIIHIPFQGTKKFIDASDYWLLIITICNETFSIQWYSSYGNTDHLDHTKILKEEVGVIKDGKFFCEGIDLGYQYENYLFYQPNNEGDFNQYIEIMN